MKSLYYFMLCAALMLAGCEKGIENGNGDGTDNGEGDGNGGGNANTEIVLSEDTKTEVNVKADEQGNGQAIKFTAAAAWTATVNEVTTSKAGTENKVDWLKLSAYSGEAGEVSLSLSLTKNFTGAARKAEIIIKCGETTIKITIEQVAENSDGSIAKQVKSITSTYEINSAQYDNEGMPPYTETENITYLYDDRGNVSKTYFGGDGIEGETIYDYSITGEIQVTSRDIIDGQTEEEKYIVTLDEKGNAVKIRKFNNEKNTYYDKNIISYTEDGRIKLVKTYYLYKDESIIDIDYKDGYITQITEKSKEAGNSYKFDIPKFYPNKYPNNNLIDMIAFYSFSDDFASLGDESLSMLSTIGRLGKTSDYFIELGSSSGFFDEELNPLPGDDPKPGKPGEKIDSFKEITTDFSKHYAVYSCEYDKDKNLKSVTIKSKFDVVEVSYDIYLTDKLVHTAEDGIKYYKTEIKNYNEEKKDEGEDITTFTLNYE